VYGYLEAVGGSLASHTLLAHTGHHLGNVDGRPLAATLAHVQGAVVPMQRVHAHLHTPHAVLQPTHSFSVFMPSAVWSWVWRWL